MALPLLLTAASDTGEPRERLSDSRRLADVSYWRPAARSSAARRDLLVVASTPGAALQLVPVLAPPRLPRSGLRARYPTLICAGRARFPQYDLLTAHRIRAAQSRVRL